MNLGDSKKDSDGIPLPEFKIPVDPGLGLEGAMNAIQKIFEGIATAAKNAIGPEMLRNLESASWLDRVAGCLEEVAGTKAISVLAGELTFHLERLQSEIKGSKFESQEPAFRQRLDTVIKSLMSGSSAIPMVNEAAGYFRAAANSVGPRASSPCDQFKFTTD